MIDDKGWAWFTTSYSEVPQIQRDDETRPEWTDEQAAAYVLREIATRNKEYFAVAFYLHLSSNKEHVSNEFDADISESLHFVTELYNDIRLPEKPPEWLKALG